MTDIRQTSQFARFMQDIGWTVEKVASSYVYLRRFSFLGYFGKIPRPKLPLDFLLISNLIRKKKIFRLKISPLVTNTDKKYHIFSNQLMKNKWQIDLSPFNPTTTILINLKQTEQQIFTSFTQTKRRGVRRAIKNGVIVKESDNLDEFIAIRKQQYFPLGFLVVNEMYKLWKNFYPQNASLLLAYTPIQNKLKAVAGILLLYYDKVAYYWFASTLPIGKKLFAPTLLVWEAIRVGKKRSCTIFDFEGIYDERFPKASQSWKGFTKFKEGFGGEKIVYLENFYR